MELMKATKESNQLYECAEFLNFIARNCSVRNSELERAKKRRALPFRALQIADCCTAEPQ